MSELDFFKSYFNELDSKIANKEFIAKLEDLIYINENIKK